LIYGKNDSDKRQTLEKTQTSSNTKRTNYQKNNRGICGGYRKIITMRIIDQAKTYITEYAVYYTDRIAEKNKEYKALTTANPGFPHGISVDDCKRAVELDREITGLEGRRIGASHFLEFIINADEAMIERGRQDMHIPAPYADPFQPGDGGGGNAA